MQDLRTTTGQRVIISYDPMRNALTFQEIDWFADPLRTGGAPEKSISMRPLEPRNVVRMIARRRLGRAA